MKRVALISSALVLLSAWPVLAEEDLDASLFAALSSADPETSSAAYSALALKIAIGRGVNAQAITSWAQEHLDAGSAWLRQRSAGLLGHVAFLNSDDALARSAFSSLVVRISDEPNTAVRRRIVQALGKFSSGDAVVVLQRLSGDRGLQVGDTTLRALGNIGRENTEYLGQVTPFLLEELHALLGRPGTGTSSRAGAAFTALSGLDDRRALDGIRAGLSAAKDDYRRMAAYALGNFVSMCRYRFRYVRPDPLDPNVAPANPFETHYEDQQNAKALLSQMVADPNEQVRLVVQQQLDWLAQIDAGYEEQQRISEHEATLNQ